MSSIGRARRGFTLVELLVVITIIGILIALLLPAVQAAREAARKLQCQNNLKQLALGCLSHEHSNGFFPSGGWCYEWVGDSTQGFGKKQPGSWVYSILPYMDQVPLWQLSASDSNGQFNKANVITMCTTPLTVMNCPTRRPAVVYPIGQGPITNPGVGGSLPRVVKGDYAGNSGDSVFADSFIVCDPGPGSIAEGLAGLTGGRFAINGQTFGAFYNVRGQSVRSKIYTAWGPTAYNGIIFQISQVTMAMVEDGTSNTFLCGEKYAVPDFYTTGDDSGDCESFYNGDDNDNERSTWNSPLQDTPGYMSLAIGTQTTPDTEEMFGSAHASGLNMAFCDGSVHMISYSINSYVPNWNLGGAGAGWQPNSPNPPGSGVWQRLGNRCDGLPVDASQF